MSTHPRGIDLQPGSIEREPLGLTEDQLRERRTGIGGSDIGAVLGVDPYRTRWHVFADKLGITPPSEETRFTRWGKRLEAVIADEYAARHDVHLSRSGTLRHAVRTWQVVTPDRLVWVTGDREASRGLEIKNKGFFQSSKWGEDGEGEDTIPDEVQAQCHWSMALTELPRWDVAALIGGNDYREYTIARDVDFEGVMLEEAERFWRDNVLAQVPPDLDGSGPAWDYLARRLPSMKRDVEADQEAERLAKSIQAAKNLLALAESGKNESTQKLAGLLIAAGGTGMNGSTWRFSVGERIGNPAWKSIAEALAVRAGVDAAELAQLADTYRGATQMVPRFTDRTKTKKKGTDA